MIATVSRDLLLPRRVEFPAWVRNLGDPLRMFGHGAFGTPFAQPMGGVTAAATFSPLNLTNLLTWAKADAGVFTDAGRTTPATNDGDAVKGWTDQSGGAHHLSNVGTGMTLKLNIQNGKPILRSSGTAQGLNTASFAHNIGTGDFYFAMMCIPRGTGASKPFADFSGGNGGIWHHTPLALYDGAYRDFNTTLVDNTAYIIEVWRTGGTAFAAVNGTQEANTPASVGNLGGTAAITIAYAGGLSHQIDVGEFLVCKSAQDAATRASNRAYLNARWATY